MIKTWQNIQNNIEFNTNSNHTGKKLPKTLIIITLLLCKVKSFFIIFYLSNRQHQILQGFHYQEKLFYKLYCI